VTIGKAEWIVKELKNGIRGKVQLSSKKEKITIYYENELSKLWVSEGEADQNPKSMRT
jgi:hypothetical protein